MVNAQKHPIALISGVYTTYDHNINLNAQKHQLNVEC
jgi:hypothetical protein